MPNLYVIISKRTPQASCLWSTRNAVIISILYIFAWRNLILSKSFFRLLLYSLGDIFDVNIAITERALVGLFLELGAEPAIDAFSMKQMPTDWYLTD